MNEVTPEFVQQLYTSLNEAQRDVVTQRLAKLTQVSFEALKQEIRSNNDDKEGITLVGTRLGQIGGLGGPHPNSPAYNIQMPWLNGGNTNPSVGMSSSRRDDNCDSAPSDADIVFFANTPQNVSPSQMRWWSTSSLVTWALNFAYGGNLSTYGYTLVQINICLGTNGVALAGGADNVRNNLKVKYQ